MLLNYTQFITENLRQTKDGEFWGNVGGGVLPICTETKRILIPLRSWSVQEPNTYGVWGGKIDEEDGETEEGVAEAVRREFYEETGFNGHIELIPSYMFKTKHNEFRYYNFIGLVDEEFSPELNWETESAKWITFDELMKLKRKHFGLTALLKNASEQIKRFTL